MANAPGLIDGEDVVIPTMSEVLGLLKLSDVIDVEALINKQNEMYKKFITENNLDNPPSEFVAFIIPLDAYIPLPDSYGANVIYPGEGKEVSRVSLISFTSKPVKIVLGDNDIKVRLTILMVALADHKITNKSIEKLAKAGKLENLYEHALTVANDAITAYKLTPRRHNHDLKPVTAFNRPSNVEVLRYNTDSSKPEEKQTVGAHHNMMISTSHARKLTKNEMTNFAHIHLRLSGQMRLESTIISKLYQAIDARCVGQEEYSIVLADTYAEHMMRYLLFQMLLPEMNPDEAGNATEQLRTMKKLTKAIAKKLNLTWAELKTKIDFQIWSEKCRDKRNNLTHIFLNLSVSQIEAQEAIDTTVEMVDKLITLVEEAYSMPEDLAKLLHTVDVYRRFVKSNKNNSQLTNDGKPT